MKTFITLIILSITALGFTQNSINYKAVVKDNNGNVVSNQLITVELSVLEVPTLTVLYQESHTPTTDDNGIFIVNIGEGSPISTGTFNQINWNSPSNHSLNVKVDIGNGLVDMGTTQFLMAPYALFAREVGNKDDADANPTNEIQTLSQSNNTITLSDGGGSFDFPDEKWSDGNGDDIYKNTGNVGIGTILPNTLLDVEDSSSNPRTLQVYKTDVNIGNDVLEIVVPVNAPDTAQFIEMQRGLSGDVVAKVDTDGAATFKSVKVTDDEVVDGGTPEKGSVHSNALPVAYGRIRGTGGGATFIEDYGINTATRTSEGNYTLTLDRTLSGTPVIMATINFGNGTARTIIADNVGQEIRIKTYNSLNQVDDAEFYVVIYGRTTD